MLRTTTGVVIGVRDRGENDRTVKVLSPEMGVIEITAKGAKKQTSSSNAATQLFACADFCFNERKGRYYLNSSAVKRIFYDLRLDIVKVALASYMAQAAGFAVTENQTAGDAYRLFMNSLYMLSEGKGKESLVKAVFELRLTSLLGMTPNLLGCAECYKFEDVRLTFVVNRGIFLCPEHLSENRRPEDICIPVSRGVFDAMQFICLSDMKKIFNFGMSQEGLDKLGNICERYFLHMMGRGFKTLDFYKGLL
ncbi:MAG: DNA repair protein RecO [Ruminococcus sp.]|nr:DNA repair protein RecO [Ruminococcus sp.]